MSEFDERKKRENQNHYAKWLSCGFKGEMKLNDCGWCINGVHFEPKNQYVLFDKIPFKASIEYMQLPNGKWIAGSHGNFPLHGWGWGLSIFNEQFNTMEEAVNNQIDHIENSLEEKDKKKFVLDGIQTCRNHFKKQTFEMAFNPMSEFEQTSLF